tara:strand:- start:3266 stop:4315 length:1050 start_codon:yes stop_codon:yes gene_type:complete
MQLNHIIAIIIGSLSIGTFAIDASKVNVGGTYLGLFNDFNKKQAQFDYATNLSFEYEIAPNVTGLAELQSSPGNGSLGFEGPNTVVTDLALTTKLASKNHITTITLGSFDTAFGHETQYLSNNADTFNNHFIINSLTYSALAGPMGTLNTLGVKMETNIKYVDIITSISNGTSETAYNKNRTFEKLLQLSTHSFIDGVRITGTYIDSDDSQDSQDSFQTHLTGILLELNYLIQKNIEFKLKKAELIYDDQTTQTNDTVITHEIELSYNKQPICLAVKGSFWRPQGSVSSLDMPNPGLLDQVSGAVDRIQFASGFYFNETTLFKTEFVHEIYEMLNTKNTGIISGINIQF